MLYLFQKHLLCRWWVYIVYRNGIASVKVKFCVLLEFRFVKNWVASKKLQSPAGYEIIFFWNVEKTFGAVCAVCPPDLLVSSPPRWMWSSYLTKTMHPPSTRHPITSQFSVLTWTCVNLLLPIQSSLKPPFKAGRFLYVPPGLTFKNSTWRSLCVELFVRISEQTATFALYIVNWLVFITVVESVYCAVRTDSLYKADYVSSLKG